MKTYRGDRTIDGLVVTVDDRMLPLMTELTAFSRTGFEWSYEGPEPSQLAFAMLVDHLGDAAAARRWTQRFMRAVVAHLDNEWEMTSEDMDAALAALASWPDDSKTS